MAQKFVYFILAVINIGVNFAVRKITRTNGMASFERLEIESLSSVEIPSTPLHHREPPLLAVKLHAKAKQLQVAHRGHDADDKERIGHTTSTHRHAMAGGAEHSTNTGARNLKPPTFQLSVEDTGSEAGSPAAVLSKPASSASEAGSQSLTVLSRLQRPYSRTKSTISSHMSSVKSALSSQSGSIRSISSNVKSFVRKVASRVRGNKSGESCSSSISDPDEARMQTGEVKRKLDSLAGSRYWQSDEDLSKAPWCVRLLRDRLSCPGLKRRTRLAAINYYIDPHGEESLSLSCMMHVFCVSQVRCIWFGWALSSLHSFTTPLAFLSAVPSAPN